jgi:hypothetical protein
MVVEPDPEFVEQVEATRKVAQELRDEAHRLYVLAGELINHNSLQWARYTDQLDEAERQKPRKLKVKRKS